MILNAQDNDNYYMASIAEDGEYSIALLHDGNCKYLIKPQGFA